MESPNGPDTGGVARLRQDVDRFLHRREIADVQQHLAKEIDIRIGLAQAKTLSAIRRRDEVSRSLAERLRRIISQLGEVGSQIGQINSHIGQISSQVGQVASRVDRLEPQAADATRLVAENRAIPYMDGAPFESFEQPGAGVVSGFRGEEASAAGDDYRSFEDRFRGPEDFIRERQRVYLDLVAGRAPVVDAGCGRGEFLDLLGEAGVDYAGVDIDAGMVARCRAKGHDSVHEADVTSYLEDLEDGSVGTVFSAQLVEHLPYEQLRHFLELSLRKLQPDGAFIAETVNPHSAQALKTFWVDPTHQHPLFPEVMLELCRITGFASAFVFHPNGSGDVDADRFLAGEYAVVATAPAAGR